MIHKFIILPFLSLKMLYPHHYILNINTKKKQLCKTLVLSQKTFACFAPVYLPFLDYDTSNTIQVQNSCIRYIFGIRFEQVSDKLNELGWLDMKSHREIVSLCLYHKIICKLKLSYLFWTDVQNLNIYFKSLITAPVRRMLCNS